MLEVDAWKVHTDVLATNSDTGAVGLVDDAVNLLEVVGVRDDLVTGEDVLEKGQYSASSRENVLSSYAQSMVKARREGGVVAQARATQRRQSVPCR